MQADFRAFLISFLALGTVLHAQQPLRTADGGVHTVVSGVEVLPVSGRPFSARSRIDWVRLTQDGSGIKQHLNSNLARDKEGRMYRERRTFVADESSQSPLRQTLVYDPVAFTKTTCTPALKHCVITSYHPRTSSAAPLVGPSADGTRYLTRETLGRNTIGGLDAIGTRETVTTNTGVVGNQRPLIATKEFWYSPDIQTNLSVKRNDPKEGVQVV